MEFHKAKSHPTESDFWDYNIQPWAFLANQLADQIASDAAERVQLPDWVIRPVLEADREVALIQNRIAAVHKFFWEVFPTPPPAPKRRGRVKAPK
eukprot:303560-Pyramimonas_sp.AAC.1